MAKTNLRSTAATPRSLDETRVVAALRLLRPYKIISWLT